MNGDRCRRGGCAGVIEDEYCNVCGLAELKPSALVASHGATRGRNGVGAASGPLSARTDVRSSAVATTGTGSSPMSRAGNGANGSRRTRQSSRRTSRKQLGAGLISLPDLPSIEPEKAVLLDPQVPERKRFCAKCEAALRREAGFCGKCGTKYSFVPTLKAGDVVAGQYEVKGPIAFGGLGWIYLGFDRFLSRYVVLKGLLNTQDESSAAAAVAERQFLAAVKHPNIVGIYNFVQAGGEGFIVMEYVGGKTLKQIRQERGPLPPAEAIAYIHRILPAFAYLHRLGLVYCDFKPDNVMLEHDDVKLIDLGGVRRIDDMGGDIYGTVGYSAPEAGEGPTPVSDLFTLGRTLAVLLMDIPSFSKEHRYTLPGPAERPVLAEQESLYRFLLKSTAEKADDRFASAEEMTEQLLGVLREVVAVESGEARPGVSADFGPDLLGLEAGDAMQPVEPEQRFLPLPTLDTADPGAQAVSSAIGVPDLERRAAALRLACRQVPKSREARLRLAATLAETGVFDEAEHLLGILGAEDPWDWRVLWFQGRIRLAQHQAAGARKLFDQVYFDLPGELAPKLALGLAAELAGELPLAAHMYDRVSQVDPAFVSAVFGLARCRRRLGDAKGAVAALDRIPASSALYMRARVEATRALLGAERDGSALDDLCSASSIAEALGLDGRDRCVMESQIYQAAILELTARRKGQKDTGGAGARVTAGTKILGQPMAERPLRLGLEHSLRTMARFADGDERVRLIDEANRVRPRTLV
jgi:serine/threonine-protein kinase PknG